MSKRVRVSRQEIMSRLHISKSTYYDLKKSLIISAINSLHQDILIEEIYKKMVNQKDTFRTKYGQTSEKITKNHDIIIV